MLKRRQDFEDASEAYSCKLLAEVSLSEERFQDVKAYIMEASGLCEVDMEKNCMREEELVQNDESNTNRVTPQLPQDCLVQL